MLSSNQSLKQLLFVACSGLLLFSPLAKADESTYVVGPGDVLQISVAGEPDFTGAYAVRSDKTIFYGYLKSVLVDKMTTRQIAEMLTKVIEKDYIASPTVSVVVKEYGSRNVKVLGAVVRPGSYILRGDTRILDVISMAGGLAQNAGGRITVIRAKPKTTPEPSSPLATTPGASPTALPTPQEKDLKAADKISPSPIAPVPSDFAEPIVVDYSAIVNDGKLDQNILLEPDDVLNVPKGNEIFVLGQVARPGPVLFTEKLTILQAISVAGGPTVVASTKSTYIIRKDAKGDSSKLKVRLDRIMEQKAENIPLLANDVIVIPESFF